MTAGKQFEAISTPTESLIVPFGEGTQIITDLCGVAKEFNVGQYHQLLRQAQKYSINVFPNNWTKLREQQAIHEIQEGDGVYYLDQRFYSNRFGMSTEMVCQAEIMLC